MKDQIAAVKKDGASKLESTGLQRLKFRNAVQTIGIISSTPSEIDAYKEFKKSTPHRIQTQPVKGPTK